MHEGSPVILDKLSSIEGDYAAYMPDPVDQMNAMVITEINSVLLEKELENRGQVLRGKNDDFMRNADNIEVSNGAQNEEEKDERIGMK